MSVPSKPVKLTLRLDRELVEHAKRYARERGTSVSQMVADYFRALTHDEPAKDWGHEDWSQDLGPLTRSLLGQLEASGLDEQDYYRYLEEKHLG